MKNIKSITLSLFIAGALVCFSGCGTVNKIFGKNSAKIEAQQSKIEQVDKQIGTNTQDKLTEVSSLSYGVGIALNKETNASQNVIVARDLTTRELSLTGVPPIDEMNKMQQLVNDLTSKLQTEQVRGKKELEVKDKEIGGIQKEESVLLAGASISKIWPTTVLKAFSASNFRINGRINAPESKSLEPS